MQYFITTIIIMLFCITALAQEKSSENEITLSKYKTKPLKPFKSQEKQITAYADAPKFVSPMSLQILVGSQGIGADVKYGFLPNLSGRLGFGIIPVNASRAFSFSSFPVQGILSTRFSNLHLLADYSPFKSQSFRLVGGASYLTQGKATAIITPSGGYNIGSRSLTKDQIGVIRADVTWKGVAPYLGFALFRSFPHRLLNVNLDVGTYYISSPGTSFSGTALLSENDTNAQQFNKNMQSYRWLPVIQLNFNFRIK